MEQDLQAPSVQLDEHGAFRLPDLSVGRYAIGLGPLPDGAYIASVTLGGITTDGSDIDLHRGGANLHVTVRTDGRLVQGTVNFEGKALGGARVVLVPESRKRNNYSLYRTAVSDPSGRFSLESVPPGLYKLFAWQSIDWGLWENPRYLNAIESKGLEVRVEAGGVVNVMLDAIAKADSP